MKPGIAERLGEVSHGITEGCALEVDDAGDDRVTGGRDQKVPVDVVVVTQHAPLAAVEGVVAADQESLDLADELGCSTVLAVAPSEVLMSVHDGLLQGWPGGVVAQQAAKGTRTVALRLSMELAEQRANPPVQRHRLALGEQWAPIGPSHSGKPGHDEVRKRSHGLYLSIADQFRNR